MNSEVPTFKQIYTVNRVRKYTQYKSYFQALQYEKLYNLLVKYKCSNERPHLLDWGGGQGHMSVMSNLIGYKTTLMSIVGYENRTQELTRDSVTVDILPTAVETLPYGDNSFDCVSSCGVLEHVRETGGKEKTSLSELTRVSKKHVIVYHFPNKYSLIEFLSRLFRKTYTHPYRYTYSDIVKLVSEVGDDWSLVEHGTYGVLPRRLGKYISLDFIGIMLHKMDNFLNSTPLRLFSQSHYFVIRKH